MENQVSSLRVVMTAKNGAIIQWSPINPEQPKNSNQEAWVINGVFYIYNKNRRFASNNVQFLPGQKYDWLVFNANGIKDTAYVTVPGNSKEIHL